MGSKYLDFQLEKGDHNTAKEYTDSDAIALSIRNLLLSRPGNYPFHPSIGINIKKYQFEILDDIEVKNIQRELDVAISACIPDISSVRTYVRKIEVTNGKPYLAISISSSLDGKESTINFLLVQENDDVRIFNEIY